MNESRKDSCSNGILISSSNNVVASNSNYVINTKFHQEELKKHITLDTTKSLGATQINELKLWR